MPLETFVSHTLYDLDKFEDFPKTYQSFIKLLNKNPPKPVDTFIGFSKLKLPSLLQKETKTKIGDIEFYESVPKLEEFEQFKGHIATKLMNGGESVALKSMTIYVSDSKKVSQFQKPQTNPTALTPDTTALSPHLKFGSLSIRTLFWTIQAIYDKSKHTQPPESLHGQLYFREYFYLMGHKSSEFDRMIGNEHCK